MRAVLVMLVCSACMAEPARPCSSPPRALAEIDTAGADEQDPWLSYDRLEILFMSSRDGGAIGGDQIWRAKRTSRDLPFETATQITFGNDGSGRTGPFMSDDGLTLYFSSMRGGLAQPAIWAATRADRTTDVFSTPVMVVDVGSHPSVTSDGKTIYFHKGADPSLDHLYRATREPPAVSFSNVTRVDELVSQGAQREPSISGDGTTLLYSRDDGSGTYIVRSHLGASVFDPGETVVETTIPGATGVYITPMLHRDGATILFASDVMAGSGPSDIFITCE